MSEVSVLEPEPVKYAEGIEAKIEEGQVQVAPRKRGRPRKIRPEHDCTPKRPGGRPIKGSCKGNEVPKIPEIGPKRPRGRPRKELTQAAVKRGRGRPKGSLNNRPKGMPRSSEQKPAASGERRGRERHKKTSRTTTGLNFIQRIDLPRYSSGLICDVTGVVTFVSSDIQEKKKGMYGYWMYKWVHLRDGTSNSPIIVKIFACSQAEVLKAITLDQVLVCTHMLLKVWAQSSREKRYCYLNTTSQSQISILRQASDLEDKHFSNNAAVNDVIKIWRMLSDAATEKSCFSGLYTFPPLPVSLKKFLLGRSMDFVDVKNTFNQMHFQQHRRLNVKGTVVAMEYIPVSGHPEFAAKCVDVERQGRPVLGTDDSRSTAGSSQRRSQASCSGVRAEDVNGQSNTDEGIWRTRQPRKRNKLKQNSEACCCKKHREDVIIKTEPIPAKTSARLTEKHDEDVASTETKIYQQPAKMSAMQYDEHELGKITKQTPQELEPNDDVASRETKIFQQPAEMSVMQYDKHELGEITKRSPEEPEPIMAREARHNCPKFSEMAEKQSETDVNCIHTTSVNTLEKTSQDTEESPPDALCEQNLMEDIGVAGTDNESPVSQGKQRYFPHVVLDRDWWEDTHNIPIFGNTSVTNGIPKLCSRSRAAGTRELPVAHQEGFGQVKGYWRVMIMGVDQPMAISAFFMPLHSEEADCTGKTHMESKDRDPGIDSKKRNNADPEDVTKLGNEASPKNDGDPGDRACLRYPAIAQCSEGRGVFIHALSHGVFPAIYPVQELLDIAVQELKNQPFVFVLDAFCHGHGDVEVLVNRAYKPLHS